MVTYKPTNARYWCVTDLECTGLEPERHEIIQIAWVVIDTVEKTINHTLTTSEDILPTRWDQRDHNAMKVNEITLEKLNAEGIAATLALTEFRSKLPWNETVLAAGGADFET